MTVPTQPRPHRFHSAAVVACSLLIALPVFMSSLVRAIAFNGNPDKVNIDNGLAYLSQILTAGFGSLGVIILVIVVLFVLVYRSARTLDALKLPMLILGIQIVVGVSVLLLDAVGNNAKDGYIAALF